jgi:hypothetical protein
MEKNNNNINDVWQIYKLDEKDGLVFVSAPNGDTQWIEKEVYEKIIKSYTEKSSKI